jgi:sigma54-dependent transcription regulator
VLGQILGERVAELDATKRARVVHVVTIARGTDIRGFAQRRASAMSRGKRGET